MRYSLRSRCLALRCVGVAMACAVLSLPAVAQELVTAQLDKVMTGFAEEGYLMRADTDSDGDPMLRGKLNGMNYVVHFYGCEAEVCQSLTLTAWFSTDPVLSLTKVNDWNMRTRFGKAYVDEDGDAVLEMSINLDGGVTSENFGDTIGWWRIGLTDFHEFVFDTT